MPPESFHLGIFLHQFPQAPHVQGWGVGWGLAWSWAGWPCLVLHHSKVILGLRKPHKSVPQMEVSIKGSSLCVSLRFPFSLNPTNE